jgi:hypothetical protein
VNGRRIAVVGPSGAGKSYVGRRLSLSLGLPAVEVDTLVYTKAGRLPEAASVEASLVVALESVTGCIIAGTYARLLAPAVLSRFDTVVWLDLPFRVTFVRALRVSLASLLALARPQRFAWHDVRGNIRGAATWLRAIRPQLIDGAARRRQAERQIAAHAAGATVIRLRSPREVNEFVAGLPSVPVAAEASAPV